MNPWSDTKKPWPIRRLSLDDIKVSWLKAQQMERYRKPLSGMAFLALFWKAAFQLRDEGVISFKSKEVIMFSPDLEEKIKGLAYKRELPFALKMLCKSGAYQTLTAMNLSDKPFNDELRDKTISTIVSNLIQGYAIIYALGAAGKVDAIADAFVSEWNKSSLNG